MKKWMQLLFAAFLMLLSIVSCLLSGNYELTHKSAYSLASSPVSRKTGLEIQEEESRKPSPVPFALWGQKNHQIISYEEFEKTKEVNLIFLTGDSRAVFDGPPLLFGDTAGCLIDEKTAIELWGTTYFSGKSVGIEGEKYEIRGLLPAGYGPVIAVQISQTKESSAKENEKTDTDNLPFTVLSFYENVSAENETDFQNRHGISGEKIMQELVSFAIWMGRSLPFFFVFAHVLAILIRLWKNGKKYHLVLYGMWLFIPLACTVLWHLFGLSIQVDARFLPDGFSDFSFYGEMLSSIKNDLRLLFSLSGLLPIRFAFLLGIKSIGWGILTVVSLLSFKKMRQIASLKQLWGEALLSLGILFLSLLLLRQRGISISYKREVWILFPAFLSMLYACHIIDTKWCDAK